MASNTILLPDKTSFNWLILNLLGQYNSSRTQKNAMKCVYKSRVLLHKIKLTYIISHPSSRYVYQRSLLLWGY